MYTIINNSDHRKKTLTENGQVFFQRCFPIAVFNNLIKTFGLDERRKKIFFRSFCLFIVVVLILQPQDCSLRDMASASTEQGFQELTGIQAMSHTALAERLQTIPLDCMDQVLAGLKKVFKGRLKFKSPVLKAMKVFDTTTFSVSAKHYTWAAKRQTRGNIRFLFIMESYSGTPEAILDASSYLNDTTMFTQAVAVAKTGDVLVFDRGYSKFQVFESMTKAKKHFITRWKENYTWKRISTRKFNLKEKLCKGWVITTDEIGWLGMSGHANRLIVRKITCQSPSGRKKFTIITDNRSLTAAKAINMYAYRWPIEVLFRHLKSSLHLVRFPSYDRETVQVWLLFVLLSVLCIELLSFSPDDGQKTSLMTKSSPFKIRLRIARKYLRSWFININTNSSL